MSDEELKQLLGTQAAETRRHFEKLDAKLDGTNQRIDAIDVKLEATNQRLEAVDAKLESTNQRIDANAAEIRADFDAKLGATNQRIDANAAEIRADFDEKLEATNQHIAVIAEHLTVVDESLSRRIDHLEAAMQEGFEDTSSLIRFAYTDLDRRIRVLEQGQ